MIQNSGKKIFVDELFIRNAIVRAMGHISSRDVRGSGHYCSEDVHLYYDSNMNEIVAEIYDEDGVDSK